MAGDEHVINILLQAGAHSDINSKTDDGSTPLHLSCWDDNLEAVSLLLNAGADIDSFDRSHQTPLHNAAQGGLVRLILFLFRSGANTLISNHVSSKQV
jgi:ankyrin repeat protein